MNLSKINPRLWWLFLISFTWYFIFSKIASSDLWWHMACGRYFFENGVYPPTDFFSYTSVVSGNPNQVTWLGDLFLYLIYYVGGEIGLHLFKLTAIITFILTILKFSGWKYNSWTLLASVISIIGTMQMHYIRNSMYAFFFMFAILWIWKTVKDRNNDYASMLLWLYPLIFWLWSKMHGYCVVGVVILSLLSIGEVIDQITNRVPKRLFLIIFMPLLITLSYGLMNDSFHVGFKNIINNTNEVITDNPKPIDTATAGIVDNVKKSYPKDLFRTILKGSDVDYIAEYKSPFEVAYTLPVKALFLFIIGYILFLSMLSWHELRFSSIIPAMGAIYLSLGYFRSTPFAFLVVMPLMVESVSKIYVHMSKRFFLMPFLVCWVFAVTAATYYHNGDFYKLTRLSNIEPGISKSNVYRDTIPNYILKKYPDTDFYNTYNTGSYLLWLWYGKKKVFIDSRSINYEADFYKDYRENHGEVYIESHGLKYGVFSIVSDKPDFKYFMGKKWVPVVFDTSMVILFDTSLDVLNYDGSINYDYGVDTPRFIGSIDDIESLSNAQRKKVTYFVAEMINSMSRNGFHKAVGVFCNDNKKLLGVLKIDVNFGGKVE